MNSANVSKVVNEALCTGCGACVSICPLNAVTIKKSISGFLIPDIDEFLCVNCSKCLDSCPGINPYFSKENFFEGNVIKAYIGYSKDDEIRARSQSGGIVTGLLGYIHDKNLVDYSVINDFDSSVLSNKSVKAFSKEDLLKGTGSYYCQSESFSLLPDVSSDEKYAAVTLGCQSQALKLADLNNADIKMPEFNIGLFCAGNHSKDYIKAIIKKASHRSGNITSFRFRDKKDGGWPGSIKIGAKEKDFYYKKQIRHDLKASFKNFRCYLCADQLNILCDISVGDPWGIKFDDKKEEKKGWSVFLTRSQKGQDLVLKAAEANYIELKEICKDEIINGQSVNTRLKRMYYGATVFCKSKGVDVPDCKQDNEAERLTFYEKNQILLSRMVFRAENPLLREYHKNCVNPELR